MHEFAICRGILDVAGTALADLPPPPPRVARVTVEVGRLTGVSADSLRHYFDLLAPATPLRGSALEIHEVPIRGRCAECAASFEIETLAFTCPACGSGLVEIVSGRELRVVSLDTEEVHGGG